MAGRVKLVLTQVEQPNRYNLWGDGTSDGTVHQV